MNTDALIASLKVDEGWRSDAYEDHLGFLSIGYGFLIDPRKGVGLPRPVGEFWLRYAVNERLAELRKLWPPFDAQPEEVQLALANMAYQMGPAGVLKFQKLLDALKAGNRLLAANEAMDSTWAAQTPVRARRVAKLLRGD